MEKPTEYCLFFIEHWATCLPRSDWAAWAQAFFSVLAIFASAGLVRWQTTREATLQAALAKATEITEARTLQGHIHGIRVEIERVLKGFDEKAAASPIEIAEIHRLAQNLLTLDTMALIAVPISRTAVKAQSAVQIASGEMQIVQKALTNTGYDYPKVPVETIRERMAALIECEQSLDRWVQAREAPT